MLIKSFWILLCIFLFSCSAQPKQENRDYYNLAISYKDLMGKARWEAKVIGDTLQYYLSNVVDGESDSLVFCISENVLPGGRRMLLDTELSQQFPIYRKHRRMQIRVSMKAGNLEEAWLKACSLDKGEDCIRRDSVAIGGEGWQDYELEIPLDGVYYVWLSFDVKGKPCEEHSGARLSVRGLEVAVDGNSVNVAGLPEKGPVRLDREGAVPLSFTVDSLMGNIPFPEKGPAVIGLGETMHGSYTLGAVKNQVIRWLVEHRRCKLVMEELPTMLLLKWDLYAQGYPVSLQECLEDLAGSAKCRTEATELLNFLRKYNANARKKVRIAGIDRNFTLRYLPLAYDYFYEMYRQDKNETVYKLLETNMIPDLLLPVTADTAIAQSIGGFEYWWFRHLYWLWLMERHIPGVQENGTMNYRDYIMWRHVFYAIKSVELQENECAVVTGHWSHLNKWKVGGTSARSLGYYLAESYGENYCSIGLLGGGGNYCTYDTDLKKFDCSCILLPAIDGSLEQASLEMNIPYFYYPSSRLPDTPVDIREVPMGHKNQCYKAYNLSKRMDGFIFVRDSESSRIPDNQLTLWSGYELLDSRLIRMMKRNKELGIVVKKDQ